MDLKERNPLSEKDIPDRIQESENPRQMVHNLSGEDFFWLVKKAEEDNYLPLLELASEEQWQYLLDLEIWRKDRLDLTRASHWLKELDLADPKRLVRWLFSEGKNLFCYYLFKGIQLRIKEEDEVFEVPDGFFTLDGIFFIKALDNDHKETIESMLRILAGEELALYQNLLIGLSGILPDEMEEEMYRLRNVRLAEHGFLPFEDALSIYAPLALESLKVEYPAKTPDIFFDEETNTQSPVLPFFYARGHNLLTEAISRIRDPLLSVELTKSCLKRINQILSADGLMVEEASDLIRTCRKAAGYLNLGLEKACGSDIAAVEQVIRKNFLLPVFRVGFGLALGLKWEAERWIKNSWFSRQGFDFSFWGDNWGATLAGLVEKKPRFYVGLNKDSDVYKEFENLSELEDCRSLVSRLAVLDKMLERMAALYPLDKEIIDNSRKTCHRLIFNPWARKLLKLEPGFSSISVKQEQEFFRYVRAESEAPPYRMSGFEQVFIKDFMAYAYGLELEESANLKDILSLIWEEFREEYERVSIIDLDERFLGFFR